jgi:hypothetical protein
MILSISRLTLHNYTNWIKKNYFGHLSDFLPIKINFWEHFQFVFEPGTCVHSRSIGGIKTLHKSLDGVSARTLQFLTWGMQAVSSLVKKTQKKENCIPIVIWVKF